METIDLIKKAFEYLEEDFGEAKLSAIVKADEATGDKYDCDSEYFDHELIEPYSHYRGKISLPLPGGEYMEFNYLGKEG